MISDQKICQKTPPPAPPFTAGYLFTGSDHWTHSSHREFVQADVLHSRPDDGEAARFCGEHVDLISPLPHIALRDSQWHWSSEYADACSQGSRKT